MTLTIIMVIAIVLLTVAVVLLNTKTKLIEEEMSEITAVEIEEAKINSIEQKCVDQKTEIDMILDRLKEIAEDIGRLDEMYKQDHGDLIDIRKRYILFREPVKNGAGVAWAKDYPCNEEEEHE